VNPTFGDAGLEIDTGTALVGQRSNPAASEWWNLARLLESKASETTPMALPGRPLDPSHPLAKASDRSL